MSRSTKDVDIAEPVFEAKCEATILKPSCLKDLGGARRTFEAGPRRSCTRPRPLSVSRSCVSRTRPLGNECKQLLKAFGVTVTELDCQTRPAELGHKRRITQASRLVDLAERDCTLFHHGEEAFAEFEHDGHPSIVAGALAGLQRVASGAILRRIRRRRADQRSVSNGD